MSDFEAARDALLRARARRDASARELFLADQRRRLAREDGEGLDALREGAAKAARAEAAAFERFAELADPVKALAQHPDDHPVLLLPLRLETRFLDGELLVRAYPDACWVDAFDPALTKDEVVTARAYWAARWAAGGVEAEERAAWRALVGAHGAGRAAWVARAHAPVDAAAAPAPKGSDEVVLVVIAEDAPADPAAVAAHWEAVWRAGGTAPSGPGPTAPPANLAAAPPPGTDRATARVRVAVLVMPPAEAAAERERSWTTRAQVTALPERLVLLGFRDGVRVLAQTGAPIPSPLPVGPDPQAAPEAQFRVKADGTLAVPDELRWMVDFERAVETGMAWRVREAAGLDRLFVLGVHVAADAAQGAALVEQLLRHHQHAAGGLALVPQGRPTNATAGDDTGFSRTEDADETFGAFHRPAPPDDAGDDPLTRTDGAWLARWLGLEPALVAALPHADGTDGAEARAMHVALWPATLGHVLDSLLVARDREGEPRPLVGDDDSEALRAFFTRWVLGRGGLPALRIGAQPYGILPVSPVERLAFRDDFAERLRRLLLRLRRDWAALTSLVPRAGAGGDPHATLLAVLGLEASSVSFAQRHADTRELQHDLLALVQRALLARQRAAQDELLAGARRLLRELGWTGGDPELLRRPMLGRTAALTGPVVDDRPLSELTGLRPVTADGRSYVRWLRDAAAASLDVLRTEEGLDFGERGRPLLHLLLRHALERGYEVAGGGLQGGPRVVLEPAYVHVAAQAAHVRAQAPSESRFAALYTPRAGADGLLHEHVTARLATPQPGEQLPEQLAALDRLDVPTARLERTFAEHLDLCSHRLDAWLLGLVHLRLEELRTRDDDGGARGVLLGAYGWVEDLRPDDRGKGSGGFVLAPSLDHAATAAVLRNGFVANATPQAPEAMAVNLSSERVRRALELLDGLRAGQSLGALLGHRLERGLHDRQALPELNAVIHDLRQAFPLVAGRLTTTQAPPGTPIEALEARNVVDGLRLLDAAGDGGWPFGRTDLRADLPARLREAVDAEVERLREARDALADLALAEAVHQSVQGNHERAAAALDAFARGGLPPVPEVVQTPRSGPALTHRVALLLDAGAVAPAGATPRALAEPALDAWLARVLPPLAEVACVVAHPGGPTTVTLADLGVRPIDVLHELDLSDGSAMGPLDDRIANHVRRARGLRPDAEVRLDPAAPPAGRIGLPELAALVRRLRTLLLGARPLEAADLAAASGTAALDPARVAGRVAACGPAATDAAALATAMAADADPVAAFDARARAALDVARAAAGLGLSSASLGALHDGRRRALLAALEAGRVAVARWDLRLAEADARLDAYDALPAATPDAERLAHLRGTERLVSAAVVAPGAAPAALRGAIGTRRDELAARRDAVRAVLGGTEADPARVLASLAAARDGAPPLADLDAEGLDLDGAARAVRAAFDELLARVRALAAELAARRAAATAALAGGDSAATQAAGRALFGEAFVLVPAVTLDAAAEGELGAAWGEETQLLRHVRDDLGSFDPVEDWLTGVARVRPALQAWEGAVLVAEALRRRAGATLPGAALRLRAAQLPRRAGAHWLALQVPDGALPDRDHLLLTAAHAAGPGGGPHAGLLLDEWVEVLPDRDVTAGLAFHFDRPSTQPPQAWLLAAPAQRTGAWDWEELVACLHEALDLARLRAVEPDHLDATPYAPFLPATVFPLLARPVSPMVDLALNNAAYAALRRA